MIGKLMRMVDMNDKYFTEQSILIEKFFSFQGVGTLDIDSFISVLAFLLSPGFLFLFIELCFFCSIYFLRSVAPMIQPFFPLSIYISFSLV